MVTKLLRNGILHSAARHQGAMPSESDAMDLPAGNGGKRAGLSLLSAATKHKIWLWLIPVLLLAVVQLRWVTAVGPGVHVDSYSYMYTSWALLHGYGFQRDGEPTTHFPPGYPALLALAALVDGNLTQAARWLHVFLYGVNIVLIGAAAYVISERSVLALVVAPLAVILSGELLVIYSTAASEPPFIAFALAAFILLSMHVTAPRWSLLGTATIFLTLATSMRYVGVTLLPAAVACLWLMDRRPRGPRMRECFFLSVASSSFLVAWIIRNLIVAGDATNRTFAFHPVALDQLKELAGRLCYLYFPVNISSRLILPILISVAVVVIVQLYRQQFGVAAKSLQFLLVTFCATYVSFLIFSISFIDADTAPDYRILAPVGVFSLVLTVSLCLKFATTADRTWVRWLSGTFVLAVLLANAPQAWTVATNLHREGYDYSARDWSESEILAFGRSIPQNVTIYTNDRTAIGYLLGKKARLVPLKLSPTSLLPNQDFARSTRAMCDDVAHNGAVVVILQPTEWRWPLLPTNEELQTACGFASARRFADGFAFGNK